MHVRNLELGINELTRYTMYFEVRMHALVYVVLVVPSPLLAIYLYISLLYCKYISSGWRVRTKLKLPHFHLSCFNLSQRCRCNRQQYLALRLPGAWACRPDLIPKYQARWRYHSYVPRFDFWFWLRIQNRCTRYQVYVMIVSHCEYFEVLIL